MLFQLVSGGLCHVTMVCHAMFITNADLQLVSGVLCHVTMVCHAMFIT